MITVLTHLSTHAVSTAVTTLTLAAALYTITLAVIAFTAVYGRTAQRRHAAHETLAVLIRHSKLTAVREHGLHSRHSPSDATGTGCLRSG